MINATNKIGVKLTKIVIGVILLLSIIISFGELVIDVQNQKTESSATVNQIVNVISPLASNAAYELNTDSAEDVITGLLAFPTVISAEIVGDKDQVLARNSQTVEHTRSSNLLNWLFADLEYLNIVLTHENYVGAVGQLNIKCDTALISEQIINRFYTNLILGILRNGALAVVLLFLFHKYLTRPIVAISKELGAVQQNLDKVEVINKVVNHDNDELGDLVNSINKHLTSEHDIGKKLYQSKKMEAVGQLTGGIAHDFNNILGIIMGNLELIDSAALKNKNEFTLVRDAIYGANRGAELTRKLLNFASTDVGEKTLVAVNEIVERMEGLITMSLSESVKTTIHLEEEIGLVRINPGDLEDALLNLSLNARDAMPDGGNLSIKTSNKMFDEQSVHLDSESEPGEYVMISISDTGCGMSLEHQEKALEPFFTTKVKGQGTGLGLSMAYSFVHRSGGFMRIHSDVGEGTVVSIYLPRVREYGEFENATQTLNLLPRGDETVLIVDDEKALLSVAKALLESLGYKTRSSENGKHALQLMKDNADIDLLFSDIIMPLDMDGYELALAARQMRPSIKTLLTTGFVKNIEKYDGDEEIYLAKLVSNHVLKPYDLSALARGVRKTLDE